MPSIASCSPTNSALSMRSLVRTREGTAGRLKNPARSTCPRTSTLRISHFPDPQSRRYARHRRLGRPTAGGTSKRRVDHRREPEGRVRSSARQVVLNACHGVVALRHVRASSQWLFERALLRWRV